MAGALVLILATHLGEPLQPASVPRGNLSFDENGHALGSSADKLDDRGLLTEWSLPEHWDLDALILSRSSEVFVTGPDDTILNGGDPGTGLDVARRTKPAIVRNDGAWRMALKTGLPEWKTAVKEEFQAWRQRQAAPAPRSRACTARRAVAAGAGRAERQSRQRLRSGLKLWGDHCRAFLCRAVCR
jgi:hypothetical protein